MKKIFLSHSSKDKPKVRKIADYLKECGIYVWVDEAEIRIGDSLLTKISDGIDGVDYIFACISNNSISSEWVNKELEMSMNLEIQKKNIIVVPVLLEDCDMPLFLRNKRYADMRTKSSYKHGYNSMLRRLGVLEPPKKYKRTFTSRELTVIDFIDTYTSLELNSDKLLLLSSISKEKEMFWFEAFLEFYNGTLLDIDTAPKEIFITALKILKNIVQKIDDEIVSRIKELINLPKLLNCGDNTIIPIVISILSALNYNSDQIFKMLLNIIREHSGGDCRNESIKYFCTILKEDWYTPDSDIYAFSEKVISNVRQCREIFYEEELLTILITNWKSDENLIYIMDLYSQGNVSFKKNVIKGFIDHKYRTLIRDTKLIFQFYSLLNDILDWNDEKLVGNFLAYAISEKEEVFDYEQIYDVLSKQSGFVLEYFIDCVLGRELSFSYAERDIFVEKVIKLIKQSDSHRKKHLVESMLFTFYSDNEIAEIYDNYGGSHKWAEEQLSLND